MILWVTNGELELDNMWIVSVGAYGAWDWSLHNFPFWYWMLNILDIGIMIDLRPTGEE